METSEKSILTVLCMVYDEDKILLQNRIKNDWRGFTLPGGHVEKGESFVCAAIREVFEETGLTIEKPELCGVKQFQTDLDERYVVFLFRSNKFSGELISSEEGKMEWVKRNDLSKFDLVEDFFDLLEVFDSENLSEFIYERISSSSRWIKKLY